MPTTSLLLLPFTGICDENLGMDDQLSVERNPAGEGEVSEDDNMWTIDLKDPSLVLSFENVEGVVEWTGIQFELPEDLQTALKDRNVNVEVEYEVVEPDSQEYSELPPTSGENWPMPVNEKMRLPRDVFVTKIKITLIFPRGFVQSPPIADMKIKVDIFGCFERK